MKKLVLALSLFLTVANITTVTPATNKSSMTLEERIKCLDLPEYEEKGMLAWIKEHKILVGTVSAVVATGSGLVLYDYFFGKKWSATDSALEAVGNAGTWVKDHTVIPVKNGVVTGAGWTAGKACDYWNWDGQTYHATTISTVAILALLTIDVSRSADNSWIKSFIRAMLGGCKKDTDITEDVVA